MLSVTKRFEFDAAHRILQHESRCKYLHGHRWVAEVSCRAPQQDSLGRVIDFGVIKEVVGTWIDQHFDHNIILSSSDPLLQLTEYQQEKVFLGKRPYVMARNPTSENLAILIQERVDQLLQPKGVRCFHVRVWETPSCYADYTGWPMETTECS
jgi:6-pyruvoyltetrahydropterin/6-carboxytetrahydropterin synthase